MSTTDSSMLTLLTDHADEIRQVMQAADAQAGLLDLKRRVRRRAFDQLAAADLMPKQLAYLLVAVATGRKMREMLAVVRATDDRYLLLAVGHDPADRRAIRHGERLLRAALGQLAEREDRMPGLLVMDSCCSSNIPDTSRRGHLEMVVGFAPAAPLDSWFDTATTQGLDAGSSLYEMCKYVECRVAQPVPLSDWFVSYGYHRVMEVPRGLSVPSRASQDIYERYRSWCQSSLHIQLKATDVAASECQEDQNLDDAVYEVYYGDLDEELKELLASSDLLGEAV